MQGTRIASSALVAGALLAATLALTSAAPGKSATAKSKQVARGEYLVMVMGCGDCHTPGTLYGSPDFNRRLSGSEMGWKGPWGVTYARNLTADSETGIGKWTAKNIVDAMRTGMRPDGSVIQPPMPWPNLAQLTDEDAYAIAAYLKHIPTVAHHVPDRLAPGQTATGPVLEFPPPTAWDAPRSEAGSAPGGGTGK